MKKKDIITLIFLAAVLVIVLVFLQIVKPKLDSLKQTKEDITRLELEYNSKNIASQKALINYKKKKAELIAAQQRYQQEVDRVNAQESELHLDKIKEQKKSEYLEKIQNFLLQYGFKLSATETLNAESQDSSSILTLVFIPDGISSSQDLVSGYVLDDGSETNEIYNTIVTKDTKNFYKEYTTNTIYYKNSEAEEFSESKVLPNWALGGIENRLIRLTNDLLFKEDISVANQMFITNIQYGEVKNTDEEPIYISTDRTNKNKYIKLKKEQIKGFSITIKFIMLKGE